VPVESKNYNKIEDLEKIIPLLREKEYHVLNLSGNSYGVDCSKEIASILKNNNSIEVCSFSDIFTGRSLSEIPKSLEYFKEALIDKSSLVELDLSDNAFGPNGAKVLVDLLTQNRNIKRLKLNNTGLGPEGSKIIAQGLSTSSNEKESHLQVFIAGRSRLEDVGIIALSEIFIGMKTLVELRVPQNGIRPEGFVRLFEALKENLNLQILDINDNNLSEEGANALVQILGDFTQLKHLDLGDCMIPKESIKTIIEILKPNENLEYLNLCYNNIDDEVAEILAECLRNKFNLKKLDINGNKLKDQGKEVINAVLTELGKSETLGSLSENEDEDFSDGEEQNDEDD